MVNIPKKKRNKDPLKWEPVHTFQWENIQEKHYPVIEQIIDWMEKNEPDATVFQITEDIVTGDLIFRADGSSNLQRYIYDTLVNLR